MGYGSESLQAALDKRSNEAPRPGEDILAWAMRRRKELAQSSEESSRETKAEADVD